MDVIQTYILIPIPPLFPSGGREYMSIVKYTPTLHKKLIFYFLLIKQPFAKRRENAVDPGGLRDWRSLSGSIHL